MKTVLLLSLFLTTTAFAEAGVTVHLGGISKHTLGSETYKVGGKDKKFESNHKLMKPLLPFHTKVITSLLSCHVRLINDEGNKYIRVKGVRWFTNIDHGRRHEPLQLMTMADNLKFNKKIQDKPAYQKYDEYDAIEIPVTLAIPSDYTEVMGVPISFLDKYDPEQFEILGLDRYIADNPHYGKRFDLNGREVYARILIRHINPLKE